VNKLGKPWEFDGKMMETSQEHIKSNKKKSTPPPSLKRKTT
jgi:hypothetical protein